MYAFKGGKKKEKLNAIIDCIASKCATQIGKWMDLN